MKTTGDPKTDKLSEVRVSEATRDAARNGGTFSRGEAEDELAATRDRLTEIDAELARLKAQLTEDGVKLRKQRLPRTESILRWTEIRRTNLRRKEALVEEKQQLVKVIRDLKEHLGEHRPGDVVGEVRRVVREELDEFMRKLQAALVGQGGDHE
jgi:transcription elongation factor